MNQKRAANVFAKSKSYGCMSDPTLEKNHTRSETCDKCIHLKQKLHIRGHTGENCTNAKLVTSVLV